MAEIMEKKVSLFTQNNRHKELSWCVGYVSAYNTSIPQQVQVLAATLPIQLPIYTPGKAVGNGSYTWAPATHVGDPYGVLGSWLQPNPALAVATNQEVNQFMEDLSHCLYCTLFNSVFQMNK